MIIFYCIYLKAWLQKYVTYKVIIEKYDNTIL